MTDNDKRQQIIEGALKTFSKHGYHKSSIKMIAKAAGIKSSALIYHYFDDKKALLEAIVREHTPMGNLPILNEGLRAQMMDMPPEIVLPQLMTGALSIQDDPVVTKFLVLYISEAARIPEIADAAYDFQKDMLNFMAEYLQHQVTLRRLKPHDSAQAARMIMSTVLIHILTQNVFPKLADGFGEREAYIQQLVDIFLNGLHEVS